MRVFAHVIEGMPVDILETAFPELKDKKDFTHKVISDLCASSLMIGGEYVTETDSGMYSSRTKLMGKQFLEFITYRK